MKPRELTWLVIRGSLVVVSLAGGLLQHGARVKPEWSAIILSPVIVSLTIYLWLTLISKKHPFSTKDSFSWTLPFFPMSRNPIRFWVLCAVVFMFNGSSNILVALYQHRQFTIDYICLPIGIGVSAGLFGWAHVNNFTTNTNSL